MNVIKSFLETIIERVNQVITVVNNLQQYVGSIGTTDNSTLTRKIDFLLDNLYSYQQSQEDPKIIYDEDRDYYYFMVANYIEGNPYIKIYNREWIDKGDDEYELRVVEIAEIENEDISIQQRRVIINNNVFDVCGYDDNTYAKIVYVYKTKIDMI